MTRKLSPTLAIFALALILPSLAFSGGKPRVPQSGDASGDAQATSGDTSKTDQNCAAWEQKGGTKAKQVCQDALNADIKYDAKECTDATERDCSEFQKYILHYKRAEWHQVPALPAADWRVFFQKTKKLKDSNSKLADLVEYYVLKGKIAKGQKDFIEADEAANKILLPLGLSDEQSRQFLSMATTDMNLPSAPPKPKKRGAKKTAKEGPPIKINITKVAGIPNETDRRDYILWQIDNAHDPQDPIEWSKKNIEADAGIVRIEAMLAERKMLSDKLLKASESNRRGIEKRLAKLGTNEQLQESRAYYDGMKKSKKEAPPEGSPLAISLNNAKGGADKVNAEVQARNADLKSQLMKYKDPPELKAKKAEEKSKFWSNFAAGMLVLGFAAIFAAVMGAPAAAVIIGTLGVGVLGTLLYQKWRANKKEKMAANERLGDWLKPEPQPEVQKTTEPPEEDARKLQEKQAAEKQAAEDARKLQEKQAAEKQAAEDTGKNKGNAAATTKGYFTRLGEATDSIKGTSWEDYKTLAKNLLKPSFWK